MKNKMREDWEEVELGEIFEIVSGNTPKGLDKIKNLGEIPYYKVSDMNHEGNEVFMKKSNIYLTINELKILKIKIYPKGTVIFPKRGGAILTNKKRLLFKDSAFDLNLMGVLPLKYIEDSFSYYWFLKLDLSTIYDGSNVPQINNKNILPLKFKVPPLPIQRAIVSKIEELFTSLDKGIADLKKAQDQLVVYRQAVLKKAFEGEFKYTTVGEIFDFVGGGTPSTTDKEYWDGDIPWASVKDIKGDFLNKTKDYISKKGLNNSSANLALKGQVILITRISPGKVLITNIDTAINQDLKIVKPKIDLNTRYVYFLFRSIERDCVRLSSGTTVLGINLQNLKSIEIPIIEADKQIQIVREIESRLSVCDKVEQSITESLEKAKALRQSILKKAFEGTLLSEAEIAKCKLAPDYEPASVLLERIKLERINKKIK